MSASGRSAATLQSILDRLTTAFLADLFAQRFIGIGVSVYLA
jgi:hypothetical protein